MDGKRYLYSAPVVDVKIAAPPRASRETGAASQTTTGPRLLQKEHTLLSRRAGRANPRFPPDLVPTQPQKKIQLSKFPAVASVVLQVCVLCAVCCVFLGRMAPWQAAAANQRRPGRIQQVGRGSPAGLAAAGGLAKSRGGLELDCWRNLLKSTQRLPRCRWGARAGAWAPW